jgi:NADPH:quinone reductase-like Zn-dependent oxidoreductase
MKAVVFEKLGGPEVLKIAEVPKPQAKPGTVLIKVRAAGINFADTLFRQGQYVMQPQLPDTPGMEAGGEIEAVGAGVPNLKPGQRVSAMGSKMYAEYALAPATQVFPIPDSISFEHAAAFPAQVLTAWHLLHTAHETKPDQTVLVHSAAGGVGIVAVQIAKAAGARVIATAGSDAKLEKARELGADAVINHTTQKIADEVKRLTNRRGVEVVFEHVGQATWDNSIRSLAVGGRLVTCGATTGFDGAINIAYLFTRHLSILGSFMGSKAELFSALELLRRGLLKPVIDVVLPLEKCAEGHKRMENRELFGKIVLKVA